MASGIKVYRITIEGFITDGDFGGTSIEPDGWPLAEIMKAFLAAAPTYETRRWLSLDQQATGRTPDIKVTATLVDTILWESETEGE